MSSIGALSTFKSHLTAQLREARASAAEVASPTAIEFTRAVVRGQTGFDDAAVRENQPAEHIASTATHDDLWASPVPLCELNDGQRAQRLNQFEQQRAQVAVAIDQRIGAVDALWNRQCTGDRLRSLRKFLGSQSAPNAEIKKALYDADRIDFDIRGMVEPKKHPLRIKAPPKPKTLRVKTNPETGKPELNGPLSEAGHQAFQQRNAIARQLREQRQAQSKRVNEATQAVDAQGLKLDRLAQAEAMLDPTCPPKSTLLSLIGLFNRLTDQINLILDFIKDQVKAMTERNQAQAKKNAEDAVEDERREKDFVDNRLMLKRIEAARFQEQLALRLQLRPA